MWKFVTVWQHYSISKLNQIVPAFLIRKQNVSEGFLFFKILVKMLINNAGSLLCSPCTAFVTWWSLLSTIQHKYLNRFLMHCTKRLFLSLRHKTNMLTLLTHRWWSSEKNTIFNCRKNLKYFKHCHTKSIHHYFLKKFLVFYFKYD